MPSLSPRHGHHPRPGGWGDTGQGWSGGTATGRASTWDSMVPWHCWAGDAGGFAHSPEKGCFGGAPWDQLGGGKASPSSSSTFSFSSISAAMGTHGAPCHRGIKATRCSQFPLKPQDGIISTWKRTAEPGRIWGRPPAPPPPRQQQRRRDPRATAHIRDGAAIPSTLPQAEIGREASGGGEQGWESSAGLDKGAAEMGAKIFRQ